MHRTHFPATLDVTVQTAPNVRKQGAVNALSLLTQKIVDHFSARNILNLAEKPLPDYPALPLVMFPPEGSLP